MSDNCSPTGLAELRARLEETLASLPDPGETPAEQYNRIEEVCIAVLDSEWLAFEGDLLQHYLLYYLNLRQLEFFGLQALVYWTEE